MADRGYIPSSPECGRWETLLTDALDGLLRPEDEAAFTAHMAVCPGCAALFEEARRGREWLEFLSPEPEIPEGLLDRILAQTGPGQVAGYGLVTEGAAVAAMPHPWQRPGFVGHVRRYAEPRLLMTAAMAFFSIALTLNLVGFKFTEVRLSDLRPSAVRSLVTRRIVTASIPIIRYYDHLRFLYQVESSMRQAAPSEGQSQAAPKPATPGGSGDLKKNPGSKNGGSHVEPPVHSGTHDVYPASGTAGYLLNASLKVKNGFATPADSGRRWTRHAHSGGSAARARERSRLWTA
ncbi:MAG TPA: zf-HC2 domain-containing protein [Terracidiphilus sp.]|nr:zf-HC2 domain-containing protein [Terracidiphilus sp.]